MSSARAPTYVVTLAVTTGMSSRTATLDVAGSAIAYLTVGLPMDSALWEEKFPVMMRNVIDACMAHGTKLVFFDNTYMYPGTPTPQTESTGFAPGTQTGFASVGSPDRMSNSRCT